MSCTNTCCRRIPAQTLHPDLKPEHVIYHHGGGPVLCDPLLQSAGSVAHVAKLVSRAVLAVHAAEAPARIASRVAEEIRTLVQARLRERPVGDGRSEHRHHVSVNAAGPAGPGTAARGAPVGSEDDSSRVSAH